MTARRGPKRSLGVESSAVLQEQHASASLNTAFADWFRVAQEADEHETQRFAAAMTEILEALHHVAHEGDLADLARKGGPLQWARSARRGVFRAKRGAWARQFVALIDERIRPLRGEVRAPWASLREHARAVEVACAAANALINRKSVSLGGYPHVSNAQIASRLATMATAVQNTAKRQNADAKAFAVALLRASGMSSTEARDLLRDKDT